MSNDLLGLGVALWLVAAIIALLLKSATLARIQRDGPREFYEFDLLKLMLPDNASHIAAVGACLAAKAGRVGAEGDR